MAKKSINALTELIIRVQKLHGDDPDWKELLSNAAKCLAGISTSRMAVSWLTEIEGRLANKWDVEEICLKWAYFVRKHPADRTLNDRCFFCGRFLPSKAYRTRDHLWPRCKGGVNTVLACHACNRTKGAMLPEHFRLVLFGDGSTLFFAEARMHYGREG
jgi:hypothetical protein